METKMLVLNITTFLGILLLIIKGITGLAGNYIKEGIPGEKGLLKFLVNCLSIVIGFVLFVLHIG